MNVTIMGCGRWASFHAWYQSNILGNRVLVWGIEDEFFHEISTTRKNEYLSLPDNVSFTTDLDFALVFSKYIIIAISAQAMPDLTAKIAEKKPKGKTFILAMKGIIDSTGERLTEVLKKKIAKSNKIAVWVGPGHPQELARMHPNIMIVDSHDPEVTKDIANRFKSKLIRLYEGDDLIGVEIGAAAKNVIGIMAGILDGADRQSLKGTLMARGAYEVSVLISAMGGKQLTAYGMSHLGDYEATLFSKNSHNRMYGEALYRERMGNEEKSIIFLAEGVATAKAIKLLAEKHKVEMPICKLCYEILYNNKDIDLGFNELFQREYAKEFRY